MQLPNSLKNLLGRLQKGPFKSGSFARNVLTIFAGTALSQAIAIGVIPILTRIFTPDQFGALATFTTVTMVFAVTASLAYEAAIVLPKRNESAFVLYVTCLLINLVVSATVGIVLILLGPDLGRWLGYPDISKWLWLAPISIAVLGGFVATSMWLTRQKQFTDISKGAVTTRLTTAVGQLGISTVALSSTGLIVGQVMGSVAGFLFLANKVFRSIPRHYWKHVNLKRSRVLLHRYRRFPVYDLTSSLTAVIARNLPIIALSYFFTPAIVGFFSIAYRMVAGPLQVGATSVTGVFFQRASEARQAGNLSSITLQTFERLAAIVMTPLLLLCMAANEITGTLLGDQWLDAGVYIRWLTLWLFFSAIASPLHRLFALLERQDELAIINGLLFVCSAGALIAGGLLDDPVTTIALFSIVSTIIWIGQGIRILVISGVAPMAYFRVLTREFARILPFAAAMLAAKLMTTNALIITGVFLALLGVFALRRAKYILGNR